MHMVCDHFPGVEKMMFYADVVPWNHNVGSGMSALCSEWSWSHL